MSQFTYQQRGSNIRINIILTATTIAAVLFGMWLFADVVRAVIIALATVVTSAGLVSVAIRAARGYLELRDYWRFRELEYRERSAVLWQSDFIAIGQYGNIGHNAATGQTVVIEPVKSGIKATEAPQLTAPAALPRLMDAIGNEPCVLIHGRRNSGKTNAACHWLAARPGRRLVIDIKPRGENRWPAGCEVRGQNDNIAAVIEALEEVAAEFTRRKSRDFATHPPLTLFVDELYYLYNVRGLDIFDVFWEIAALGRSYNVHAGLTSSGKEVELLGAKGRGSLRDNLAFVRLKLVGNERFAYVDLGDGEFEAQPPGQYQTAPTEEERILAAYKPGKSLRAICRDAGLPEGGNAMAKVKAVLEDF